MHGILRRGAIGVATLLLISGCGRDVRPTGSAALTRRTPAASSSPSRTPEPQATATPATLTVERAPIPGPFGTVVTDGSAIAWSGGDPEGVASPDLYRWNIGTGRTETVFKNSARNRAISLPAMQGDRFAFSESGSHDEGFIDWNFFYVAAPGAAPLKLASARRPIDSRGILPQPTISGDRLVYAIQTINGQLTTSQLISLDLRTLDKTVLAKSDFDEIEYWYPSLDGDNLVYGTVEYANDPLNGERHVYLLDLGDPGSAARQLDSDGEAAQPAIYANTVVWKAAPRDFNANNWGQLVRYSLTSGRATRLDFLGETTGYYLARPDVGPRFVAAEPSDWTRLAVYDLETDRETTVEEVDPRSRSGFLRPTLAGSLFAWVAATDFTGTKSEIHFVRLPGP